MTTMIISSMQAKAELLLFFSIFHFFFNLYFLIFAFMSRPCMQAGGCGESSHLQPGPGQHLPVHGHQGRRQEHGEDDCGDVGDGAGEDVYGDAD